MRLTGCACKAQAVSVTATTKLPAQWGERLRQRRETLGLSLAEVARRVGTDRAYYTRIERGEIGGRGVGDDVRIRIATALDVRVEDIWAYPDTRSTAAKAAS